MAEVSKTARKSRGEIKKQLGKRCPGCGEEMVATKVIGRHYSGQGGMFWICQICHHRERVRGKK